MPPSTSSVLVFFKQRVQSKVIRSTHRVFMFICFSYDWSPSLCIHISNNAIWRVTGRKIVLYVRHHRHSTISFSIHQEQIAIYLKIVALLKPLRSAFLLNAVVVNMHCLLCWLCSFSNKWVAIFSHFHEPDTGLSLGIKSAESKLVLLSVNLK